MKNKILKNLDFGVLICSILLFAIGLVALFSATQNADFEEFKKQIVWFWISIPIMIIVIAIDYNTIVKISPFMYRSNFNITCSSFIYKIKAWGN